jgi:hypothetical protein
MHFFVILDDYAHSKICMINSDEQLVSLSKSGKLKQQHVRICHYFQLSEELNPLDEKILFLQLIHAVQNILLFSFN